MGRSAKNEKKELTANITVGTVVPSNTLKTPIPRRESEIAWLQRPEISSPLFIKSPASPGDKDPKGYQFNGFNDFYFGSPRPLAHHPPSSHRSNSLPTLLINDSVTEETGPSRPKPPAPTPPLEPFLDFSHPLPSSSDPSTFRLTEGDQYTEPSDLSTGSSPTEQQQTYPSRESRFPLRDSSLYKSRGVPIQSSAHFYDNHGDDSDADKEVVSPHDVPKSFPMDAQSTPKHSQRYVPGPGARYNQRPPPIPKNVPGPGFYRPTTSRSVSTPVKISNNRFHSDRMNFEPSSTICEKSYPPNPPTPGTRSSTPITLKTTNQALHISTFHEVLFVAAVILANFMTLAGLGQAMGPREYISQTFRVTNAGEQSWFTASYSLTVGTFILVSGRMGDIIGHKRMLIFGYFFLGVWSSFSGFSAFVGQQSYFDFCRAFQGIGAAMLAPNALALLGRAYVPGLKKNVIFSLFGAMAPWGFIVGATASNLFAQLAWWPWLFWTYAIAAWGLAGFALLVIPQTLGYEAQFAGCTKRPSMDWMGSTCGVTGLILFNIGINNAPLYGWRSPYVYFLLALGVFALAAFIWVQIHTSSPLIPAAAMNTTVLWTLLLVSLGWGSFGIWLYYTWRYLMDIRNLTALAVSAEFSPALIAGLVAAIATAFLLSHTPVSFTMFIAMCAFFAGEVISYTQPIKQTYWAQTFVAIIVLPFGMDMSFPAATILLSNYMPREHQGIAASLVNTVVNYSISMALGIAGSVEASVSNGGLTAEDFEWGIQCAFYTSLGLSGLGVFLGLCFFAKMLLKEGWKVMDY
ncbi:Hypothetical protein R9X50_00212400 [Acrodontium crateriforme]|uniref:Major facilitator superfamily (MFS) profile domain-containing protein n=1 Tax=Acrodontium crateriforme TaxID=150365 RepID=A0AAQ3M6D3_9PEZI|nr:Hypothetical protein R9X50_00212400 [Acrodontium crateriforme]